MKKQYNVPEVTTTILAPQTIICGSPESDSIDNMNRDAVNTIIWY